MSKNDALDTVLQKITDEKDWQFLNLVCGESNIILENLTRIGKIKAFNKAIRNSFAYSLTDIFRNEEYDPDYDFMLKNVAKSVRIDYIPKSTLTQYDIIRLEQEIFNRVIKILAQRIDSVSNDNLTDAVLQELKDLCRNKRISEVRYNELKKQINEQGLFKSTLCKQYEDELSYLLIEKIIQNNRNVFIKNFYYYEIIVLYLVCPNPIFDTINNIKSFIDKHIDIVLEKQLKKVLAVAVLRRKQKL